MELSNIQYFNDQVEDDLKAFYCDGMIGLQNLKSGKKTIPCYEHIITSPKYIFVEVDESWGLLDKDLCLIIPPKYQVIYPVKVIDREDYISMCLDKAKDSSGVYNADCDRPPLIAIQNADVRHYGRARLLMPDEDNIFDGSGNLKEKNKATLYEIDYKYEQISAPTFVLVSKNNSFFIDLSSDNSIIDNSKEFFFLWHYKDHSFIFRNNDSSFGFSSYWEGRFHKETLICLQKGENDITYSPKIIFHRNDFVSVCLPVINKRIGNTTYKDEQLSISGKWALFRFGHRKRGLNYWKEKEESYFQQLTPYAFKEPLFQTCDGFTFICREMGKEWLIKYDESQESLESSFHNSNESSEKAATLVDEYMHSHNTPTLLDEFLQLCFKGCLSVMSPIYNSIEPREDGLFDISTDEGYGLCDENMKVIVPTKYDYPIEWGNQLMIVSKDSKYGVIKDNAEEIVPCVYTSIKIGTDRIEVWNYSSEYDDYTGDWKSQTYIGNQCDIPINNDDRKDNFFIVGINTDIKKDKGIFGTLRLIPNHYSNNKVFGSLCDIYLPTGEMITHFSRIPKGGIDYSKEYGIVTLYERIAYSEKFGEFYEGVRLYSIETHKTSAIYTQIYMIDKKHFLAFGNGVGIVTINLENDDCFQWSVPHLYFKISIPINNIIYALKWEKDKEIIDVYDLSENYKLISSIEHIDSSLSLEKGDIKEEQRVRLINLNEIDDIKYFPFDEYHESNVFDSCLGDSYGNDLRDAFEDDPEAMWGREW